MHLRCNLFKSMWMWALQTVQDVCNQVNCAACKRICTVFTGARVEIVQIMCKYSLIFSRGCEFLFFTTGNADCSRCAQSSEPCCVQKAAISCKCRLLPANIFLSSNLSAYLEFYSLLELFNVFQYFPTFSYPLFFQYSCLPRFCFPLAFLDKTFSLSLFASFCLKMA